MHPVYLIFPVALAVNFSFILPVSTPGNAIVFAYGDITVLDMVRMIVIVYLLNAFFVSVDMLDNRSILHLTSFQLNIPLSEKIKS